MSWKLSAIIFVLVLINGAGLMFCVDAIARIKLKMREIEKRFDKVDKNKKV